MKKVLRPPQAKNEAPVWVAPAAASGLGVVTPQRVLTINPLRNFSAQSIRSWHFIGGYFSDDELSDIFNLGSLDATDSICSGSVSYRESSDDSSGAVFHFTDASVPRYVESSPVKPAPEPTTPTPKADSRLEAVTPLPQVKRAPLTPFRASCGPVPPTPTTPTRLSGPAGAGLPVSHYASAFIATTKAASRPEKQKSASNAAFLCVCGDAAAHPFRHGSDCSGTSVACEGVAMQSRRVRPLVSMANLSSRA